jgi:hypothetical protein
MQLPLTLMNSTRWSCLAHQTVRPSRSQWFDPPPHARRGTDLRHYCRGNDTMNATKGGTCGVLTQAEADALGAGNSPRGRTGPWLRPRRSRGPISVRPSHREDLIWFRRADPLATFKYQVYDVRKGEYTAAVETWVKDVQTKYPSYLAVVRDVDLKHENGETEKLRLAVPKDVIRILLRGRCTRERQPARSHSTSARGPNSALPFPCSAA